MQAFRFTDVETGLSRDTIPIPTPGPGQVLLSVKAVGLCHSDANLVHGVGFQWLRAPRPMTLGHEVAGEIVRHGPPSSEQQRAWANEFPPGTRVAVAMVSHPIETCNWDTAMGIGSPGGYAEYTIAYGEHLVRIPQGVSYAQAAVATDSISTAYHATLVTGAVRSGMTVGIIGIGGLGMNAAAVAALEGARVYAADTNAAKFDAARRVGVVDCAASLAELLERKQGKFDVVIDFVGIAATVQSAITAVRDGGTVVLVGLGATTVELPVAQIISSSINVAGSIGASMQDLVNVLDLIQRGDIKPDISEIPFADIPRGLDDLGKGTVQNRLFACPT
ncbi:alcohol dehydrogenase, propanol-preferring [Geosmithia morbida]|uniref:Alcohol dehydrogenase, propanol-preferring n=1 Tax=Geosmithia morbida TaxID=1094350 RepID=A0A9P4Z355_9HYPO|nr:alcohol dehydrogenase, propanol-preferring [Geosmithia morbida]KAF4126656.1 alcohol dehydrogenase, propanol-preferring [Geosmithia morbida]